MRNYTTTINQAKWLQTFQCNNLKRTYGEPLLAELDRHCLYVFLTHDEEWIHNKGKILEINQTYPVVKISAEMHGLHTKKSSADQYYFHAQVIIHQY